MKVNLIYMPHDVIKVLYTAARTCISVKDAGKIWKEEINECIAHKLIHKLIQSGHHSVFEHIHMIFTVDGISRACLAQLSRHRFISMSVKSQRYVNHKNAQFTDSFSFDEVDQVYPFYVSEIKRAIDAYSYLVEEHGISKEDARMLLPNAITTSLVLSLNLRALMDISKERLCINAQQEIRELITLMCDSVFEIYPSIGRYLMPKCKHLGYCPEMFNPCGMVGKKKIEREENV